MATVVKSDCNSRNNRRVVYCVPTTKQKRNCSSLLSADSGVRCKARNNVIVVHIYIYIYTFYGHTLTLRGIKKRVESFSLDKSFFFAKNKINLYHISLGNKK